MKTSARFLAMLLAVVMVASAALSVSAFDDVAGNKHANAINVLAQLGVIGGYEDGTFKPDQKVTRAEMAKLSYVLYTTFVDAGAGATAFSDVAADNWAAGYIRWCSAQGIIGGYGNGKFGPTDNVTYDQALKMVCGVLGYNEWDSNLWPTDVRGKALRDLELGEGLEDVKGGDQLTRAQVAQIMYNALNKPMNETRTENKEIPIVGGGSYFVPVEVAKTLQADIWKITEVNVTVESVNVTKNEITLSAEVNGKTTHKLADLGLEEYEGTKANALKGLELLGLKKTGKTELLGGLTVVGSVVDGVKVEYNKAEDTLTVDGVEYKAVVGSDDAVDADKTIKVNGTTAFEKKTVSGKDTYVITAAVKNALDAAYMARAIDVDGDAVIDELKVVAKTAYKVQSVGKTTDKLVSIKTLDGETTKTGIKSADISIAVAKDDVLVVAELGGIYYAEKVEAVETYATKLNTTGEKVTLAEVGEVKYGKLTVAGVDKQNITTDNLGKDNATGYYIYNGEIILAEGIKPASEYTFAILKEVIESDEETFNPTTMKKETSYEAVLIVKGEEIKVTLPATGTAIVVDAADTDENKENNDLTAEAAASTEKFGVDKDAAQLNYNYTLVAGYEKNKDGETVITVIDNQSAAFGENDYVVSGTIAYDAERKLYTVGGKNKVVLDDESVIYYTYKKEASEDFDWLGYYTKDTITDKKFDAKKLNGKAFLVYNTTAKTYTLLAAFVDGEIKGKADGVITYTEDGTLVLYAPADSNVIVGDNGENYYEHTFMDNEKIENAAPVVNTDKKEADANETEAGEFYAWNATDEVYVKVTPNIETFKKIAINGVFENDGYILEYADTMDALAEDITIWGLYVDEEGNEVYDVYKTLTLAEFVAMVDEVNAYNADEDNADDLTINAILVRSEDANVDGKYNIESIIVEIYEENEDGALVSVNSKLFAE